MPRGLRVVRKGGIGQVTVTRAFHIQNEWPKGIGNPPNEEPPKDCSWDGGAARPRSLQQKPHLYRFRWFYDYSGGQLTNFGVHYLDLIHWALSQDAPLAVTTIGGNYAVADNREVPDTLEVLGHSPATRW